MTENNNCMKIPKSTQEMLSVVNME